MILWPKIQVLEARPMLLKTLTHCLGRQDAPGKNFCPGRSGAAACVDVPRVSFRSESTTGHSAKLMRKISRDTTTVSPASLRNHYQPGASLATSSGAALSCERLIVSTYQAASNFQICRDSKSNVRWHVLSPERANEKKPHCAYQLAANLIPHRWRL